MRVALFVVAITFIVGYVALHTGFIAYETGVSGLTLYVGPLNASFGFGYGSWFPGQYL